MVIATIIAFAAWSLCGAQTFNWDWQKAQIVPKQPLRDANLSEPEKPALAAAITKEISHQDDTRGPQKEPKEAALETCVPHYRLES